MQPHELKASCCAAQRSAAGLDHFSPEDFSILYDETYVWLTHLLNDIESGAPWPDDLTTGRTAFLSKDPDKVEDPLAYRVLLILPVLYRRWASTRLNTLRPWVRSWQLDGMFAGIEGFGAEDAWWESSLQIEHCKMFNKDFSGNATDIFKCFDQRERPLIYLIAKVAGIPTPILSAYQRYQEKTSALSTRLLWALVKNTCIPTVFLRVALSAWS